MQGSSGDDGMITRFLRVGLHASLVWRLRLTLLVCSRCEITPGKIICQRQITTQNGRVSLWSIEDIGLKKKSEQKITQLIRFFGGFSRG